MTCTGTRRVWWFPLRVISAKKKCFWSQTHVIAPLKAELSLIFVYSLLCMTNGLPALTMIRGVKMCKSLRSAARDIKIGICSLIEKSWRSSTPLEIWLSCLDYLGTNVGLQIQVISSLALKLFWEPYKNGTVEITTFQSTSVLFAWQKRTYQSPVLKDFRHTNGSYVGVLQLLALIYQRNLDVSAGSHCHQGKSKGAWTNHCMRQTDQALKLMAPVPCINVSKQSAATGIRTVGC